MLQGRFLEEKLNSLLQSGGGEIKQLLQIHAHTIANGLSQHQFLLPKIVAACGLLNRMCHARRVFDETPQPNVILYNTMFKAYAENEFYVETVQLYEQMHCRGVRPNNYTFPFVFRSLAKLSAFRQGTVVHSVALKMGLLSNVFVSTTLVDFYAGCQEISSARRIFDEMPVRNVVSWTAIITGYIFVGQLHSARCLFDRSPENDIVLWNTMLVGYRDSGEMVTARQLFDQMPVRDVISWNSLLIGHAKNGDLSACKKVFEEMPLRNVFSWNGMLGAYANSNQFHDVLDLFNRMLESEIRPNDASVVIALSACARLGALDMGKWVHSYANSNGLRDNLYVGNGLVDMYAKCGSIETAICLFEGMHKRDVITWNAMIGGLSMHGHGLKAVEFFERMQKTAIRPDGITFVGVLSACTHAGLLEEGLLLFHLMPDDYGITPMIEHYGCMVDLLGRTGLLAEAVEFIKEMPLEADSIIWSALLGACKTYGNIELGEYCIQKLTKLEPTNGANYVLMSNIYGAARKWDDFAEVKATMKERRIQKLPGCSSLEVNNSVYVFYSLDDRHPMSEEVCHVLKGLTKILKSAGYVPKLDLDQQPCRTSKEIESLGGI